MIEDYEKHLNFIFQRIKEYFIPNMKDIQKIPAYCFYSKADIITEFIVHEMAVHGYRVRVAYDCKDFTYWVFPYQNNLPIRFLSEVYE